MAALLVAVPAITCCTSFPLPPAPTAAEQKLVASTHFHATVGVERYREPGWSFGLLESLRATGLFDRVELLDNIESPNLIARVREPVRPAQPFWILPTITLGVIPAIASDQWGEVFTLHSGKAPDRSVPIDFKVEGGQHVGWLAVLTGLPTNRSWIFPPWTRRYRDALAVKICQRAPEIQELVKEARGASARVP